MTLREAIEAKLEIEPGRKISTFGGWSRQDRVLMRGKEIGKIQTRRGRGRYEVVTIAGNLCVMGYDIDWLVKQGGLRPQRVA